MLKRKTYTVKVSILIIFLILMRIVVFSQEKTNSSIVASFQNYQIDHFQEKVFIHTDKSFYLSGETIWMKAYLTDGFFHALKSLSKVVYIDILDRNQNPVLRTKIAINESTGEASISIPSSILTGNYLLRGYTQWMKNFGAAFYYEEPITIVNTLRETGKTAITSKNKSYDIQFFPEGGTLLYGVNSVIAFKAIDQYETSVSCKGYILNQRNDTVVQFNSLKFGMGNFELTPKLGDQYIAHIQIGDSIIQKPIPPVNNAGYVLKLTDNDDQKINITVHATGNASNETINLFIHAGQIYKNFLAHEMKNGEVIFTVDKNTLAEGISHFTIFNSKGKPVCERLYFRKPQKKLAIDLSSNKIIAGKREKLSISLSTRNELLQLVAANLSMSVFLVDSLQSANSQTDILSYLLLSSDLKGSIESPAFYLNDDPNTEKERVIATENLMLTQGWSRFRWEDIQTGTQKFFDYLPETEGPLIRGKITQKKTGAAADKIMAYLSVPGTHFKFSTAISNTNGDITFNPGNYYSASKEIIVQTNNEIDSNYRINITDPFSDKNSDTKVQPFYLPLITKNNLITRSFATQVEHSFDQKVPETINNDTINFYGNSDNSYQLDAYTRFTSMEEVMREYVSEVRVKQRGGHFQFNIWNKKLKRFDEDEALLLMDGVPVFNTNKMIAFDPLKIKQLDVLSQTNITGGLVSHGILSYHSYQGDLANFPLDANALVLEYESMQKHRDFYIPQYNSPERYQSRLPDMRNVLFWEPNIMTDKTGKKSLQFYTSDLPGNYAIIVQGISLDGTPGYSLLMVETK